MPRESGKTRGCAKRMKDTLGEILENDDEDARDNLADYMDELKEESENVGRPPQTD